MIVSRHMHKRSSSQWVPPSAPLHNPITILRGRSSREKGSRMIQPNHMFDEPRYDLSNFHKFTDNAITTTKYGLFTFIPYNIFHQMTTKYANMYFLFIAVLNFCPVFGAFTKFLGLIPIGFVLCTTLVKDGFEDFRRWRYDSKINLKTCHVWDRERHMFRKMYWKHILVGDFVHVSNEQEIPADVLFLRSSDENGTCYVETCNLDGETSLKQRLVPRHYLPFSQKGNDFTPPNFTGTVFCEPPDPAIYTIRAKIERAPGSFELITKDNMLLRGSRLRNTTFIEGIVLYAGHDTKVMMNNGRAPHKISGIELLTNRFIVLCMIILTAMVVGSSLMSGIWLGDHPLSDNDANVTISPYVAWNSPKPVIDGVYGIGSFIICYQVIVPISLYITVEIIKIAQIFFLSQDIDLYDPDMDRAIDCRSLNIPEELGQISHVLSDKTGTLTENIMIFRNCAFDSVDYGPDRGLTESDPTKPVVCVALQDRVKSDWPTNTHMKHFFLNMVLNNSVVVNKVPHHDALEVGFFEHDVYNIGNSSFYDITAEQFKEMVEQFKSQTALTPVARPEQIGSCLSEIPEDSEVDSTIGGFSTLPSPTTPNFDSDPVEIPAPVSRVSSFSKFVKRNLISPIITPITSLLPYDSIRKRHETVVVNDFCPYEAESPDELAIIMGASLYGFKLEDKSATHTIIGVPGGAQERYEVLQVFPFHAERKRMSVVVKTPSGPLLYCKGADSAILSRLRRPTEAESIHGSSLKERLDEYSCKGLRTLAFAMRLLDQQQWEEFLESYRFVMSISSNDRDQLLSQKADEIEKELELLGVTGIEDRLQDGVEETIVALREAGMQVWVLTGDKLETAENIARSCGLFAPRLITWKIETREDLSSIRADGYNLVLSPQATHLAKLGDEGLLTVLRRAKSVLCYRMTPSEKAEIVKCVKTHLKGRVLTIGDGANDVPMIQAAHVGIGIVGKEGMQAAMACDFAIVRFQFLRRLLLVHGHWCYDRLSLTFLYFLYKNTNNVFLLFFFQLYNGWSASFNTDPVYSILYPIIFSSLQPIVVGVIDQDASADELLSNPVLYSPGRKGTKYTYQLFAINTIDGIWQAAVVFFTPFLTFTGQECGLWLFGFYIASGMMFTNTAHLAVEVRCWNIPLAAVFIFFIALHFGFFILYGFVSQPR
ncbi:hypothetical protein V3C99_012878 [Haemonchus contortus]